MLLDKSMEMINFDNHTDFELDLKILENIADELSQKEIELILTDNKTIQEINKAHRNINKPTDVLSFPVESNFSHIPLGSVVISLDYAKAKAVELSHCLQDEIALLFIHGVLHLLGFDHENDKGEQRKKEEELIKKFQLPSSLIVRNS